MAVFKLSRQQMNRLKFRFEQFRNARLQVHRLMKEYIDDYKNFQGDSTDRQEYLEGKYIMLAPSHSHIKFDGEEIVLWSPDDIALLTGRRQSTISRVIKRMERTPGWCSRLAALSVDSKSANNNDVKIYRNGIFDLIFDKYEDEYLARYTRPRRGNSPDSKEVLRFWNYLKDSKFHDNYDSEILRVAKSECDDTDIPPMSYGDIAMLIFRKILTPKTGMIFSVIFAVTLAAARKFPGMIPIFAGLFSAVIPVCAVMIRTHRFRIGLASDAGAVALLCAVFWVIASFSDGVIYTPAGNAVELHEHERSIELYADMWKKGKRIFFRVISDKYEGIKEVFFRVNDDEYKSTGFNEYHYPVLMIEPETQHGDINIDVKYIDARNKEYGPYKFVFNADDEREKLKRKAENDRQELKREKKESKRKSKK